MNRADYVRQLVDVSDYIYDHLDDDLDLFRLAEVAHLSSYHWHRVYRAMSGESAASTVRRLRLQRAAGYLADTAMPVREVAARSGFASAEVFSRNFREAYGVPPARFRASGDHTLYRATSPVAAAQLPAHPVDLRGVEQRVIAASPHRGAFVDIGRAFARALEGVGAPGAMVAVYYDDAEGAPDAELRSAAGIEIAADAPVPAPLERIVLPAGEYAVLAYRGPYASMRSAYTWFYGSWLPQSGRVPADFPVVEEYLNDPVVTPPGDLRTDIMVLLEG